MTRTETRLDYYRDINPVEEVRVEIQASFVILAMLTRVATHDKGILRTKDRYRRTRLTLLRLRPW